MANELNELDPKTMEDGKDVDVIAKQLPITISNGWKAFFNIGMWFLPPIIGGIIVICKKAQAKAEFKRLEQKIQQAASQVDNYLEQRVVILTNAAKLLDKAIDLDKTTFKEIAKYRGGNSTSDEDRNDVAAKIDSIGRNIQVAFEQYPNLKAHEEIADAMQQNSYLQKEITAARDFYNDCINQWNTAVNTLYIKQLVAAEQGYTTRIPFIASKEVKKKARSVLF